MSFESRATKDLIKIASAGGGFTLTAATRATNELVRIAAAASNTRAHITFTGLSNRPTEDLIRIAKAGKGCVTLEE